MRHRRAILFQDARAARRAVCIRQTVGVRGAQQRVQERRGRAGLPAAECVDAGPRDDVSAWDKSRLSPDHAAWAEGEIQDMQLTGRRFEQDRTWMMLGMAIRMATDLNLHRKSMASGLDTEEGRARDLEVRGPSFVGPYHLLMPSQSGLLGCLPTVAKRTDHQPRAVLAALLHPRPLHIGPNGQAVHDQGRLHYPQGGRVELAPAEV